MEAAIAAFREAAREGIVTELSQAAATSSGRPLPSAPTTIMSLSPGIERGVSWPAGMAGDRNKTRATRLVNKLYGIQLPDYGGVEDRTHRGPDGLGVVEVGAARGERDTGLESVGGTDYRADVSRVLNAVQQDDPVLVFQ